MSCAVGSLAEQKASHFRAKIGRTKSQKGAGIKSSHKPCESCATVFLVSEWCESLFVWIAMIIQRHKKKKAVCVCVCGCGSVCVGGGGWEVCVQVQRGLGEAHIPA